MKNVLIICDTFPPAFAPRMGYLCKYLPEYGWNPIIITEKQPHNIYPELAEDRSITYINYYQSTNKFIQQLKYTFVFLADFFFDYKNIAIKRTAQKIIEKQKISLILSSTYRVFPVKAACQLSKKNSLPIVMDLRDIVEQFPKNEHVSKQFSHSKWLNRIISSLITRKLLRQRNVVLKKADYVTTVSEFHVRTLKKYNEHVTLIYNGYDPELFFPKRIQSPVFTIVYTGRILSLEMEDPSLLFQAVSSLSKKGVLNSQDFRIQFYTDEKTKRIIQGLSEKYGVEIFVDCYDMVQSSFVPGILHNSSILLLLTNKAETGSRGIMTTKFFEYLAVEKPILCVRNDEDCLQEHIIKSQSGISADTVEQVENYIMEKYTEWKENGYTHQQTNKTFVEQFSRKIQAKEYISIFESLLQQ